VRTRGVKARRAVRIGIESRTPHAAGALVFRCRTCDGDSGDYRNYFVEGGHATRTRSTRERRTDPAQLCSVTVVDDDCMQADALATALIVLARNGARSRKRPASLRSSSSGCGAASAIHDVLLRRTEAARA